MPSPMMTQYQEIKSQHPNDIVFFRLGDFYEMFGEDAKVGSKVLNLVLTKRKNTIDGEIPMCGVPFHSSTQYISRLIKAGYSVALTEQTENASDAKKLVNREVVKVITPGTVLMDGVLDGSETRSVMALFEIKGVHYGARIDIQSGIFEIIDSQLVDIQDYIQRNSVLEVVVSDKQDYRKILSGLELKILSESRWSFDQQSAFDELSQHFGTISLEGFGLMSNDLHIIPAGAVLSYLKYTQKADLKHIHSIRRYNTQEYMRLDYQTIQNLELFEVQRKGLKARTVFDSITHTMTPMGMRLMRNWLITPLLNIEVIRQRQDIVSKYYEHTELRETVRDIFGQMPDLERLISRIASGSGSPRDLGALRNGLLLVGELLKQDEGWYCESIQSAYDEISDLLTLLQLSLDDSLPPHTREGGFIRQGYRADIDELIELKQGGKEWLEAFQQQERESTQVSILKVGYNNVYGYYIEISNTQSKHIPAHYIKRQTLTNAGRYITEELKEFEEKILSAQSQLIAKEQEVFSYLESEVIQHIVALSQINQGITWIDCIQSLAELAVKYDYHKPDLEMSRNLVIEQGRHPVLEQIIENLVSNDISLNDAHSIMIITGPNMGGKSTYMRQVALIVLLAQIGSFVPAQSATIGLVDAIFTRVGASDNLSEGQSTFMVEMTEVAHILNNATHQSLIILDEVGRGTATYDGMSIAHAIIEYIHQHITARTLFATHYHELLRLESEYERLGNYHVAVNNTKKGLIFLHTIREGGANQSYGIEIARLAGFPEMVLQQAYEYLQRHEKPQQQVSLFDIPSRQFSQPIIQECNQDFQELRDSIMNYDLNTLTPIQALNALESLQQLCSEYDTET